MISELEHVGIGEWPKSDNEWRQTIRYIKEHLDGIKHICKQQSGPEAKDALVYEDSVNLWHACLGDYMIRMSRPDKQLVE